MVAGGVIANMVFVPFTLAHGPTSYNLDKTVLGGDMLVWGLLLGTLPVALIGGGLWTVRGLVAGDRMIAHRALTVMCVTMFLFVAMNLAFGALGPPFDLFVLAPAGVVAAVTVRPGALRLVLALIATAYVVALLVMLIPPETSDSIGGYRIFGSIAYAGVGLLWIAFGVVLATPSLLPSAEAERGRHAG